LKSLSIDELCQTRIELWNNLNDPPPLDKTRGERFLEYLKDSKIDDNGNLSFILKSKQRICEGAFLRLLGILPNSANPSDAAPMWSRLKADFKNGSTLSSLTKEKLKLDNNETFSVLKGEAKAYILAIAADYSDAFATVTSFGTCI